MFFPRVGSRKSRVLRPFWSNFHSTKVCVFFLWFNAIHMCVQDEDHRRLETVYLFERAAVNGFIAAVLTAISRPISRSERDHSIREAAAGEITSERLFFVFRPPKRPRWHKQMTSNLFRPKLSSATRKRTYFTIKRWNLERRERNARSRRQQFTVARLGGGYRVTVRSHCAVNHVQHVTDVDRA